MSEFVCYKDEKKKIDGIKDMMLHTQKYANYGVKIRHAMLLSGPEGVGKKTLINTLANNDKINIYSYKAGDCENEEEVVVDLLTKNIDPKTISIIVLEDIDKIAGNDDSRNPFMPPKPNSCAKAIKQIIEHYGNKDKVFVFGTCVDPENLAPELRDDGLFDLGIEMEVPDYESRLEFINYCDNNFKLEFKFDKESFAKACDGLTFGKIKRFLNDISIITLENHRKAITEKDMEQVREWIDGEYTVGCEKSSETTAVHEAGHALVGMLLVPDELKSASIVPNSESYGRVTFARSKMPGKSIDDILNRVKIGLAGKIAEKVVYGKNFLGNSSDLKTVATVMYNLYVSEAYGGYDFVSMLVRHKDSDNSTDEIRNKISKAVEDDLYKFDREVEEMIRDNRELFDDIVANLVEKKHLSKAELAEIREKHERKEMPLLKVA